MNRAAEALCAALREGPEAQTEFDLTALTPVEWQDVAAMAIRQRVGPLLLSRTGLPMPADVRETLRTRAQVSARRALMQQAAFRQLADSVARSGISLIALKGIHLATDVYPSAALREMDDLDVLVLPEHLTTVVAIARDLGYAPLYEQPLSLAMQVTQHLPRMIRGSVALEIHWRLSAPNTPPLVTAQELLERARPLARVRNAFSLSPEDALLHLCAHAAASHLLVMGLRPLCDIAALVRCYEVNWTTVIERSSAWECERSVGLVLALARRYSGAAIPETALKALDHAVPPLDLLETAMTFITFDTPAIQGASEAAGRLIHLSSIRARLKHVVSRIVLPPAQLSCIYPGSERSTFSRWAAIVRRIFAVGRRHLGWVVRAARDTESPLRAAVDRRNALADWIHDRPKG